MGGVEGDEGDPQWDIETEGVDAETGASEEKDIN